MIATFTALLLAHVLADFVFQPDWMVARKGNVFILLLHAAIVLVFSTAALGGIWEVALVVATAHLAIDAIKAWALPRTFTAFAIDQSAHVATIAAAAYYWSGAFDAGLWAPWGDQALAPALILSGFIVTVFAGGFAVGLLTTRFQEEVPQDGLADAGRLIGRLERTLIFLLVFIEQPAGIGFLIAAKSILRFDTAAQGQKAGEYVIIGTLASFAWAMAAAYGTVALLEIAAAGP
ncbi:DUF3307 domain-containing protein [Thalassococcus sp. CAU 1522]|uniref:DUF3307 domain-containing protein n=1 Tax=Thalassococcus arenae TaxID=2851652 RepID=A0ABS6N9I0_9RHOB|nr:DUF3307 domain-containing protein [Thalassococcus arenae]MBV2360670.1 DUF3307 domain-containing protein [Thalassococcus arenae]